MSDSYGIFYKNIHSLTLNQQLKKNLKPLIPVKPIDHTRSKYTHLCVMITSLSCLYNIANLSKIDPCIKNILDISF